MKKVIILTIAVFFVIYFGISGSKARVYTQKDIEQQEIIELKEQNKIGANIRQNRNWEYACFVYKQNTTSIWRTPETTESDKDYFSLCKKLNIKYNPLGFPPTYDIIQFAGNNGWELIQIHSEDVSTTGAFEYWFKKQK